jgi:hypothetical protein
MMKDGMGQTMEWGRRTSPSRFLRKDLILKMLHARIA